MERRGYPTAAERAEAYVDAPGLVQELGRRKWSIIVPTVAAAALGFGLVTILPARFTGTAKVLLENQESYLTRPDKALTDSTTPLDDEAVQSAAEALSTPDIARKAIADLEIANRPEFHPSGLEYFVSMIIGTSRPSVGDPVVDSFLNHTTVFPIARSRLVQIEFSSRDRQLAARAANELANLFLDSREDAKKAEAKSAADWLSSRIDPLRAKVADAERALEAFRSSSGLLAGANGLTTPSQRLAELTTQIATARAAQSAAKAKADALRDMVRSGRLDGVAEATQNESLRRYAEARVALKAQMAELSRTYGPEHPRMKAAVGQLAGLEDEIKTAAAKSVRGYEEEARIAADQVRNLDAEVTAQSKIVASGDGDLVKLRSLELDARTAREQLESYLNKYREAAERQTDDAGPPNARIVETASAPSEPSFPKRVPTILLTTLAGFVLALGVATARALMSEGAPGRTKRETIIRDAPPVVAAARRVPAAPPVEPPHTLETIATPDAAPIEPGDTIEGAFDRLFDGAIPERFVMLVAAEGSRGALPIALMAGRRLAARSSGALIDLGISQPWLSDVIERDLDEPLWGLSDLIDGRAGFEKILHRDLSSRLDIALPGDDPLGTEDLDTILAAVAENYEYVIVHASDWREAPGRAALRRADAVILCGAAGKLAQMRERLLAECAEKPPRVVEFALPKSSAIEQAA